MRVILHIGDTVTHFLLGTGVVTIADEEYCTVKFEKEELTFRLPEAFEEGFIASNDAEIKDDDDIEEEEVLEEDEVTTAEPSKAPAPKREELGCLGTIFYIGYMALIGIIYFPFIYLFFVTYSDGGDSFFLVLAILGILFYVLLAILCLREFMKPDSKRNRDSLPQSDTGLSTQSKVMAMLLGATLAGNSSRKKHKSIFDSARDDLFWQEKVRRDSKDY